MFKFLRKYNKMLLAIFGVLLMITFLIPQAFNQFSQQAAARTGTVATVGDGEKISALEWDVYQRELRVIDRLRSMVGSLPGVGDIKTPEHWYLLVREAQNAGLVPVMNLRDLPPEQAQQILDASGERDIDVVQRAITHYDGVRQLLNLYTTGSLYSDRRVRSEAERLLHIATARLVVIQPDPAQSTLQPTEQQIEEQMKKYADKLPGEGEFGFGYKLPDRLKIEWLTIPAASVRALVEKSEAMDAVQQRLHWKRNPNKNLPPYPTDGSAPPIPDVVRTDLLNQLTKAKQDEIAKFAADTLRLAQRGLPEKDGYLVLPADWATRQKPLPQLAEDVQKRFASDLPSYSARGDGWLTISELTSLPGIGAASSEKIGATPVPFSDLAKATHEFGGNATVLVQRGVAGPPLKDLEGNLYIFRITDTDASRPPASADEVREQVVKDLRREADYQRIKAAVADLQQQARTDGLVKLALEHNTIVQPESSVYLWNEYWVLTMVQYRMPLSPQRAALPIIGDEPKVTQAIIDFARSLPQDKPIDQVPEDQRITAVASDDKLAVVVAEITGQQPLSRESFDRLAQMGAIQTLITVEEADPTKNLASAFSYDSLAKRNGFALKRESEEKSAAESTKTEPAKTAAAN